MKQEAAISGFYNSDYMANIEKMKIITVQQILNGERMSIPLAADVLKKAAQADSEQSKLF